MPSIVLGMGLEIKTGKILTFMELDINEERQKASKLTTGCHVVIVV